MRISTGQKALEEFRGVLEAAADSAVRALDVFYFDCESGIGEEKRATTFTLGDRVYLEESGILSRFLERYGTLAQADEPRRAIYGALSSPRSGTETEEDQTYRHETFSWSPDQFRQAKIQDLIGHLNQEKFGGSYFITTVPNSIGMLSVHLSVFIVFSAVVLEEAFQKVQAEVHWWLARSGTSLLAEQLAVTRIEFRTLAEHSKAVNHHLNNLSSRVKLAHNKMATSLDKGDIHKAKEVFSVLENLEVLRDFCTDALTNFSTDPFQSLLASEGITTFTEIVTLLKSSCIDESRVTINKTETAESHPANVIDAVSLFDVFSLVKNLWDNAWNAAAAVNGKVTVCYETQSGSLVMSLINSGVAHRDVINYLVGEKRTAPTERQGVRDIRRAIERLTWIECHPKITQNTTQITLVINPRDDQ